MNFIWFVDYRKSTTLFDFSKEKKMQIIQKPMLMMPHCELLMLISQIWKFSKHFFLIEINELDTSSMKRSGIASTNMGLPC